MNEFNYYDHLKDVKKQVLDQFVDELTDIEEPKEIYFHDIISEVVDENIPYDNIELITIIEESGNESEVEEGFIDSSKGLQSGVLMPMAYECLKTALFEDQIFMDLQDEMNNEIIDKTKATELITQINQYIKEELD